MYKMAIVVFAGLVIGNFIWQAFKERDWGKAIEKSITQAFALGAYLVAMSV